MKIGEWPNVYRKTGALISSNDGGFSVLLLNLSDSNRSMIASHAWQPKKRSGVVDSKGDDGMDRGRGKLFCCQGGNTLITQGQKVSAGCLSAVRVMERVEAGFYK